MYLQGHCFSVRNYPETIAYYDASGDVRSVRRTNGWMDGNAVLYHISAFCLASLNYS